MKRFGTFFLFLVTLCSANMSMAMDWEDSSKGKKEEVILLDELIDQVAQLNYQIILKHAGESKPLSGNFVALSYFLLLKQLSFYLPHNEQFEQYFCVSANPECFTKLQNLVGKGRAEAVKGSLDTTAYTQLLKKFPPPVFKSQSDSSVQQVLMNLRSTLMAAFAPYKGDPDFEALLHKCFESAPKLPTDDTSLIGLLDFPFNELCKVTKLEQLKDHSEAFHPYEVIALIITKIQKKIRERSHEADDDIESVNEKSTDNEELETVE